MTQKQVYQRKYNGTSRGIRERGRARKNIFRSNSRKLQKFDRKVTLEIQEAQQIPSRINTERYIPSHILVKLKEKILKAARTKRLIKYKETLIRLTTDFL